MRKLAKATIQEENSLADTRKEMPRPGSMYPTDGPAPQPWPPSSKSAFHDIFNDKIADPTAPRETSSTNSWIFQSPRPLLQDAPPLGSWASRFSPMVQDDDADSGNTPPAPEIDINKIQQQQWQLQQQYRQQLQRQQQQQQHMQQQQPLKNLRSAQVPQYHLPPDLFSPKIEEDNERNLPNRSQEGIVFGDNNLVSSPHYNFAPEIIHPFPKACGSSDLTISDSASSESDEVDGFKVGSFETGPITHSVAQWSSQITTNTSNGNGNGNNSNNTPLPVNMNLGSSIGCSPSNDSPIPAPHPGVIGQNRQQPVNNMGFGNGLQYQQFSSPAPMRIPLLFGQNRLPVNMSVANTLACPSIASPSPEAGRGKNSQGGFLPMQAVMEQNQQQQQQQLGASFSPLMNNFNNSNNNSIIMDGSHLLMSNQFSSRYRGRHTMSNASASCLPTELNCALWLTNLPPDITTHKLLAPIRNIGRIWCTYINHPDNIQHKTAAAKIVFFNHQSAQRLLCLSWTSGLLIDGFRVRVSRNRIKAASSPIIGKPSRVLIITGLSNFVNEKCLMEWFGARFKFEVDEVVPLITTTAAGGRSVVEFRFGSYRCQGQMGKIALEKDRPEWLEHVEFGDDPCEVGDGFTSYAIAAQRIQGMGMGADSSLC